MHTRSNIQHREVHLCKLPTLFRYVQPGAMQLSKLLTLFCSSTEGGVALQIAYLVLFWLEMHFPSRNDWLAGLWSSSPCHMHCAGHVNWFVTILAHWLRRPISTSFRSFHNMIIYWTLTMTKKTTTQMFWHHMPTKRTYISRVCSVHLPPEARNF